jgi:Ca2+/Na+ antiporter
MGQFTTILLVIAIGVLTIALVYTWRLAKNQKAVKENLDTKIPMTVKEHPYLRNPIFIAFALFFVLLLLYILYLAQTSN